MILEEILLRGSAQAQLREFARNRLDTCIYCGLQPPETTDHIIPRKKNGPSSHWNLIGCCRDCNRSKGTRDWFLWWMRSGHFEEALQAGRVKLLLQILTDRRSLADYLVETLEQNPSFKVSLENRSHFQGYNKIAS
jgi:hypothetical protein